MSLLVEAWLVEPYFLWGRLCSSNQAHELPWNFLVSWSWHLEVLRLAGGLARFVRWRSLLHLALAIARAFIRVTWQAVDRGLPALAWQRYFVPWSPFWLDWDRWRFWHSRSPLSKKKGSRSCHSLSKASPRVCSIPQGLFRSLIEK